MCLTVQPDLLDNLAQFSGVYRFKLLGQFARNGYPPAGPERFLQGTQERQNAVPGLIKNQRSRLVTERTQSLLAGRLARGQKSLEHEAVSRQTGNRQRRNCRAGTRHRQRLISRSLGRGYQSIPGVTHQRSTGITDERQVFTRCQSPQQAINHLHLIVFMQGLHGCLNPIVLQQLA